MPRLEDAPAPRRKRSRRCGCGCGGGAAGDDAVAVLAAEFAGTALLVALSCLPACAGAAPAVSAAVAGLVVALLVQCFDHVSGAMLNPTVLLAALCARRVAGARAAAVLAAQLAGGAAGGGLLLLLAPPAAAASPAAACLTLPRPGLPLYKAVCIEAMLGGLLALASMASWDARNRLLAGSWPLRIGFGVAGLSLVAAPLTGAGMNPARSLAPALWSATWDRHWVYWVGPLGGSLLCSLLYRALWAPPDPRVRPRAAPDCCVPAAAAALTPAPAPAPAPALRDEDKKMHYSV